MAKTGPTPLIDERDFVPCNLEQARQLRARLMQAGESRAKANGIVMWLVDLPHGDRATTNAERVESSRNRRVLLRLGEPPWWGGRQFEDKGALITSADQFGRRRRPGRPDRRGPRWGRTLGSVAA